ncbi:hypothetical protein, partial [Trebonia kvetii]|uniref:hypothetical protein n=1 Tax=Trebonia kvetii TaxID=2480626 RepID=UPI001C9E49E4
APIGKVPPPTNTQARETRSPTSSGNTMPETRNYVSTQGAAQHTPGYKPKSKWKPATGTGIAPDIHPPARPRKSSRQDNSTPARRNGGSQPWH